MKTTARVNTARVPLKAFSQRVYCVVFLVLATIILYITISQLLESRVWIDPPEWLHYTMLPIYLRLIVVLQRSSQGCRGIG